MGLTQAFYRSPSSDGGRRKWHHLPMRRPRHRTARTPAGTELRSGDPSFPNSSLRRRIPNFPKEPREILICFPSRIPVIVKGEVIVMKGPLKPGAKGAVDDMGPLGDPREQAGEHGSSL